MIWAEVTATCVAALLRASWQGGAAIALAWLVSRTLRRLPPAWRCWLWRGATAKLLLSFALGSAVVLPLLPARPVSAPRLTAHPESVRLAADTGAARTDAPVSLAAPAPALSRPLASTFLVLAWAIGVIMAAASMARAQVSVRHLQRAARAVADQRLVEACIDLCRRLGLARVPGLVVSSQVGAPALVGWRRPSIILPDSALTDRDDNALRMMLAHELAHLKRRDLWWNWLPALARTLFWFHPLVWVASRELRLAQESACDELAMAVTGAPPRRYGAMLLDMIEAVRADRPPAPLFSAAVVDTRRSVERRLTAMTRLNATPFPSSFRIAGAITLAGAVAVALVPWRMVAQTPSAATDTRIEPNRSDGSRPADPAPAETKAGTPGRGAKADTMRFPGVVTAPELSLGVPVGGVVADVPVNVGDAVKSGQLLARLDDSAARAALVEAEANYRLKQAQYKRMAELRAANNTTEAEVVTAEAEAQVAAARIEAAKHALMTTRVVAPGDGVVAEVAARPGEVAQPGAVLVKLIDRSKLSLRFHLPEQYLSQIKVGKPAAVTISSIPDASFEATIASVAPVVQTGSGTVVVQARFDDTNGRVRPGMAGEVALRVDDQRAVR